MRGFDRETFAFAIAIQNLMWGLGQPVAGAIADRYGSGRVLAGGGLLYVLGTVLMSQSTTGAQLALTGGVLLGLGLAGGSFMIVLAAFARLVPEDRRSWAMGLATAAGSLGQFLFAPLGQAFIAGYGAVTALVMLSFFVALVPLLAIALTGRGEESDGRAGDLHARGDPRRAVAPELPAADGGLLRLRLPHRVRHHAPAAVPRRPRLQRLAGGVVRRADRALQRDRRLHRRRARRAHEQAPAAVGHLLLARDRVPAVRRAADLDASPCCCSGRRSACCGCRPSR